MNFKNILKYVPSSIFIIGITNQVAVYGYSRNAIDQFQKSNQSTEMIFQHKLLNNYIPFSDIINTKLIANYWNSYRKKDFGHDIKMIITTDTIVIKSNDNEHKISTLYEIKDKKESIPDEYGTWNFIRTTNSKDEYKTNIDYKKHTITISKENISKSITQYNIYDQYNIVQFK